MAKRSEQVKDVRFRADASGCLSRPAFEGAVTAALKREPLATLVHLDLDDLLVLNEKAGREAGDKAINASIATLSKPAAKEQGGDAVGLTPSDDMVLKSSYYSAAQLGRLKGLAERQKKKEAALLREALDD